MSSWSVPLHLRRRPIAPSINQPIHAFEIVLSHYNSSMRIIIARGRFRRFCTTAQLSSAIPSLPSSLTSRQLQTLNTARHAQAARRSFNPSRIPKRAVSMAWYCSGSTNTELIENLFSAGLIKNERVKNAMIGVDRAHYAPSSPYSDSPQPIGHSATISAPHMHGHACEYLIDFLKPGSRVLDIGSGSGYLTHVLANLITDPTSPPGSSDGQVIGIDHIPELIDLANKNMSKSEDGRKFLSSGKVKFITADGRLGWEKGAPYDVIHVGAAAENLHPVLVNQLRAPGRMFIPVETENNGGGFAARLGLGGGQYIWVVDKKADGSVHKEKVFQVSYVPLTDPPRK